MITLQKLLKGEVAKGTLTVTIGNCLNAFLSMIFVYFCSVILNPTNFGLFSICLTTWFLLQEIFDFGLNNLTIRLAGQELDTNKNKSFSYFRSGFLIRFIFGLIIFLFFLISGKYFSTSILRQTNLFIPLLLTSFGEIGAMIFTSLITIVITLRKFKLYTFLYTLQGLSRLVLLFLVYINHSLTLNNLVLVFITAPFLTSILGLFFLPIEIWKTKFEKEIFVKIFGFIKWLSVWGILASLANRTNVYILTSLVGPEKTGVYNLAYLFASIPLLLTTSLSNVLLPKVSQVSDLKKILPILKKTYLVIFVIVILMIIIMIPGASLLSSLLGRKYLEVTRTYQGIMFGMIIVVLMTPLTIILWVFNKPKKFLIIATFQFIVSTILGFILIKNFSLDGAALSYFLTNLLVLGFMGVIIFKTLKNKGLRI